MCGIVCIISNKHLPDSSLHRFRDYIAHRGPDGAGMSVEYDQDYQVALGHRRLAVLDLSSEALQPMANQEKTVEIAFNGELYNYKELKKTLQELGFNFRTKTDTEVLLAAYLAWGADCLQKLNGMFAFAIWDKRQKKILIARDRFGEKPLFWAKLPNNAGIIFASEMKAILQYPEFDKSIDSTVLEKFIHEGQSVTNNHKTPFQQIHQVPSATAFNVNHRGEIEKSWTYWDPDFTQEHKSYNPKDAKEEFYQLFEKSVLERAHCDVQFGACLSGGLDSTSIVGVLKKYQLNNFDSTISLRFDDDPTISDGKYIDHATSSFQLNHVMVTPEPKDLINDFAKIHWHHEVPLLSASMFLEWSLMKKAKDLGNVVMLDGQGSDELLGGYPYYFKLYQQEALNRGLYRDLLSNTRKFSGYLKEQSRYYVDAYRRIPMDNVHSLNSLFIWKFKTWLRSILSETNDRKIANGEESSPNIRYPKDKYSFKHKIATGLTNTVLQEQLHSADRNGMAFGIETRFPFLDYQLVDWAIGLPLKALVDDGFQKSILRNATLGMIPREITYRKDKLGFLAPQDTWIKGPLQDFIRERVFSGKIQSYDFYQQDKLQMAWRNFIESNDTHNNASFFWRLASLNEWLDVFELRA